MGFDYERNTRNAYKDDQVAQDYHSSFTSDMGMRGIRFQLVASREVDAVRSFIKWIRHEKVIDIPAGTGKLAPMFSEIGSSVLACDISESMLAIARHEYSKLQYHDVQFAICDAAKLSCCISGPVDAIVCLRLMHRVPANLREKMLTEFAKVADFAIISYGVESTFHRLRRKLRALLLGGGSDALSYESIAIIRRELNKRFRILGERDVIPLLSQERIFLVHLRPDYLKASPSEI